MVVAVFHDSVNKQDTINFEIDVADYVVNGDFNLVEKSIVSNDVEKENLDLMKEMQEEEVVLKVTVFENPYPSFIIIDVVNFISDHAYWYLV